MDWSRLLKRALVVITPLVLVATLVAITWPQPRVVMYSLYREHGREQALSGLAGYHLHETDHFLLYYKPVDHQIITLVADVAEDVYPPVVEAVGYRSNKKIPVIVYPDRDELRQAFGWNRGVSAVGVYFRGTIRLLSPNVWINASTPSEQNRVFKQLNPIAHELTHYLLDYRTSGNYPTWFTEGLAQVVEYQISGYLWLESQSSLRQPLYTLSELDKSFNQLANQPLAYRQSYLLIDYMQRAHGEMALASLIERLGQGAGFRQAVLAAYGLSMEEIFLAGQDWIFENVDDLDIIR